MRCGDDALNDVYDDVLCSNNIRLLRNAKRVHDGTQRRFTIFPRTRRARRVHNVQLAINNRRADEIMWRH